MASMTRNNRRMQTIIVGAGMAGISAAERLIQQGFDNLLILEASDRIGGRIETKDMGDGWVELGAQWIHGEEDNVIYEYARQHDLLSDQRSSYELNDEVFHTEDGRTIDASLCERICDIVSCKLERVKSDPGSMDVDRTTIDSFLDTKLRQEITTQCASHEEAVLKRGLLSWYKKFQCSIEGCDSLSELSLRSFEHYKTCEGNPLTNLKRGYSRVVQSIAKCIPEACLVLNKSVDRIEVKGSSADPVTVSCSDGSTYMADHVIVTVSLGVLKQHADTLFRPQLSLAKQQAIQKMGFGTVDKIFLEFERPFWQKDSSGYSLVWVDYNDGGAEATDPSGEWSKAIFGFYTVPFSSNVLCGWVSGHEARHMETVGDREVCDICIQLLRRFTGKADLPNVKRILRSKWNSDPHTVGSYSYLRRDLPRPENANDILAEPMFITKDHRRCPVVMFAGEATHHSYFSTVHGARETGLREAERILGFYSKVTPSPKL